MNSRAPHAKYVDGNMTVKLISISALLLVDSNRETSITNPS
jgi:hypothetical protein